MATVENTELVERFDQFFRNYYRDAIGKLAQRYPNEQRSLTIDWADLYRFDQDLADDYLAQPDQLQEYAEEALRLHDLPVDVSLGQAHVRLQSLDEATEIRAIRARDVNKLVAVQGIIRKATDVRPKVQEAAFECQRCGTLTYIPQSGAFQEPHECQGCERQGPFTINYDQSTFVDAQKLRIQESPEGLRGGETPQSIDVHIEDDLTGRVAPGDHVTATGVLRIEQQTNRNQKTRMFDVHMEGHSIVIDDEEFEDMDITDQDKRNIVELSQQGEALYEQFIDSIAPSIYGFDDEKLAMTLQLFAGVTKHLPDETRIRGDLHILLIGDPGTGKCVSGDTKVTLADGAEVEIRELVEGHLDDPIPVDDGVYQPVDFPVPSLDLNGTMALKRATKVWKREAPEQLYRIRTRSGHEVEVTPSHPLYIQSDGYLTGVKAEDLREGQFIATPRHVPAIADDSSTIHENSDADLVPNIGNDLRRIRGALGLSRSECGLPYSEFQHFEDGDRNPSRASLRAVVEAFEARFEKRISHCRTAGIDQSSTCQSKPGVIADGGVIEAASSIDDERIDDALEVADDIKRLHQLAESDICWERIESIEEVESKDEWVYDLEVEDTHNYLTNGIISHNSQLLQYIRHIAPRSVYTSGKGSSAAGITAAAVKDDFGDGQQWSLEAGALVLADMGIAAVDELDKMRPEDRSALHEALEQQSISISKAGINATLKARCALLGAANPKYGRFDQYEPIAEQIDLEPALISRFDLIFTVTDAPDEERDAELADHILRTNYAGELRTQRDQLASPMVTDDEVESSADTVMPAIEPELFRKYVAYAKRNVFPSMTDEARKAIRDFYVDLRARGTEEDSPVPITARKLEALVRLAEASARVRLSDTVEVEDADRVIAIVRGSLKDIGVDPETGQFDADVIETGTSKTQRDRIKSVRALIQEIETEYEEGAPVEEVISRAGEAGIDESKVEHEIEQLRQRGEVYEPATGHLRTT